MQVKNAGFLSENSNSEYIRYSLEAQLSVKPESGGGLLLLRCVTPLQRRNVAYSCSGV
jgi:hypothetical protein